MKESKSRYFADIINNNFHRPKTLFTVFNTVVNPTVSKYPAVSKTMCEDFLRFFVDKINSIRRGISHPDSDPSIYSVCCAEFSQFKPISFEYLQEIVCRLKPSGSTVDILPPYFLKQVFDAVGPYLVTLINRCFETSSVPDVLKHATVYPLLKRHNLDPIVLENYRPISNLSFITKILEKIVLLQLQSFLDENKIFEVFQSGFRKFHSTETALLKVSNDILLTGDSGNHSVLVLLDLSAAFDTVDHAVLLTRLEHCAGITGSALEWFNSYLLNRRFNVNMGHLSQLL